MDEIVDILILVVEDETMLVFVVRVMPLDVLKIVVGITVKLLDVLISEEEVKIVAVFVEKAV